MSTSREKYENTRLRSRKKVINIFTFFLNKNVWRGVTTYLCEREVCLAKKSVTPELLVGMPPDMLNIFPINFT